MRLSLDLGLGSIATLGGGQALPPLSSTLYILPSWGQSLSLGQTDEDAPLVYTTNPYPAEVLTFGGTSNDDVRMGIVPATSTVLDAGTLTSFTSLIAKYGPGVTPRGETMLEASAAYLAEASRLRGERNRFLSFTAGVGSQNYANLKKGTQPYTNFMAALTKAVTLATGLSLTPKVLVVPIVHGESDFSSKTYYADMLELWADLNADIKTRTGQSENIVMMMNQPSSFDQSNLGRSVVAQAKLQTDYPTRFRVVGPNYNVDYSTDYLHLLPTGYNAQGQRFGPANDNMMFGAGDFTGVRLTNMVRTGNVIDLDIDVEVGPAVLDTTTVTDPGNYGFTWSDTSSKTISSVALTGDTTIRITLSGTPDPGGTLSYGMVGHVDAVTRVASTIPRGNLRDSATVPNWCKHFQERVTTGSELAPKMDFSDGLASPFAVLTGTATVVNDPEESDPHILYLKLTRSGGSQARSRWLLSAAHEVAAKYIGRIYFRRQNTGGPTPGGQPANLTVTIASGTATGAIFTQSYAATEYIEFEYTATQASHWLFVTISAGVDGDYGLFNYISLKKAG